jgi:DNA repair and recombination protein RAD52
MTDTNDVIKRLNQPLEPHRIRHRQAPGEGTVPYLEGYDVLQTANEIFNYRWSFDLLSDPHVMVWEHTLTTWDRQKRRRVPLRDADTGKTQIQKAGMVYLTGKITVELDGKAYTHADVGRLSFTGDTPEALDTALSGAATDCLKRCFRQLGNQFGLSLYDKSNSFNSDEAIKLRNQPNENGGENLKSQVTENHPSDLSGSMTIDKARQVLCPVGSRHNPQWAGMPLGQVISQPKGDRMLAYLAGEQFKANGDPARHQARQAAKTLLGKNLTQGE